MAFNPNLKYNDKVSLKENVRAMMHWLNFVCREMTVGRVVQNKEETDNKIAETKEELTSQLLITDEIAVELYEQQLMQEEINIAQDEAIVAIYEMMEGV